MISEFQSHSPQSSGRPMRKNIRENGISDLGKELVENERDEKFSDTAKDCQPNITEMVIHPAKLTNYNSNNRRLTGEVGKEKEWRVSGRSQSETCFIPPRANMKMSKSIISDKYGEIDRNARSQTSGNLVSNIQYNTPNDKYNKARGLIKQKKHMQITPYKGGSYTKHSSEEKGGEDVIMEELGEYERSKSESNMFEIKPNFYCSLCLKPYAHTLFKFRKCNHTFHSECLKHFILLKVYSTIYIYI